MRPWRKKAVTPSVIEQKKRLEKAASGIDPGMPFDAYPTGAVQLFQSAINLPLRSERQLYASLAIIEMLQDRGDYEDAEKMGKQFVIKNEKNAHLYPNVLPFWISIVRSCMLIGDYDKANEFILTGYQWATDPEVRKVLTKLAAQIKVEEATTFENLEDESDFLNRLFSLCNAVKTNVQVLPAYRELMFYIDDVEAGTDQEFWLRDAVLGSSTVDQEDQRDPRLPGIIHITLGFREIVNGRKSNGLEHWEIASQQFDMAPLAINFLIQVYSAEHELSRRKKMHLVNCGIQRFPQSPFFYATRGRFHLDDEAYEDAIKDLQFANARIPSNINILENLLDAMNKLLEQKGGEDEELEKEIEKVQSEIDLIKSRIAQPEGDQLSKFVQEPGLEILDQDSAAKNEEDKEQE